MNWSALEVALVPEGVVTVIFTMPAEPTGLVAVIVVEESIAKLTPVEAPKATTVAPVKLVPVIVTVVPPAVVPELGLTAVTVGGVVPPAV